MRTMIDLPEELLQQARIAAVERGVTLRELIAEALVKTLALAIVARKAEPSAKRRRIQLPIFSSREPGSLMLTNADLARAESEEDLRRHAFPH